MVINRAGKNGEEEEGRARDIEAWGMMQMEEKVKEEMKETRKIR